MAKETNNKNRKKNEVDQLNGGLDVAYEQLQEGVQVPVESTTALANIKQFADQLFILSTPIDSKQHGKPRVLPTNYMCVKLLTVDNDNAKELIQQLAQNISQMFLMKSATSTDGEHLDQLIANISKYLLIDGQTTQLLGLYTDHLQLEFDNVRNKEDFERFLRLFIVEKGLVDAAFLRCSAHDVISRGLNDRINLTINTEGKPSIREIASPKSDFQLGDYLNRLDLHALNAIKESNDQVNQAIPNVKLVSKISTEDARDMDDVSQALNKLVQFDQSDDGKVNLKPKSFGSVTLYALNLSSDNELTYIDHSCTAFIDPFNKYATSKINFKALVNGELDDFVNAFLPLTIKLESFRQRIKAIGNLFVVSNNTQQSLIQFVNQNILKGRTTYNKVKAISSLSLYTHMDNQFSQITGTTRTLASAFMTAVLYNELQNTGLIQEVIDFDVLVDIGYELDRSDLLTKILLRESFKLIIQAYLSKAKSISYPEGIVDPVHLVHNALAHRYDVVNELATLDYIEPNVEKLETIALTELLGLNVPYRQHYPEAKGTNAIKFMLNNHTILNDLITDRVKSSRLINAQFLHQLSATEVREVIEWFQLRLDLFSSYVRDISDVRSKLTLGKIVTETGSVGQSMAIEAIDTQIEAVACRMTRFGSVQQFVYKAKDRSFITERLINLSQALTNLTKTGTHESGIYNMLSNGEMTIGVNYLELYTFTPELVACALNGGSMTIACSILINPVEAGKGERKAEITTDSLLRRPLKIVYKISKEGLKFDNLRIRSQDLRLLDPHTAIALMIQKQSSIFIQASKQTTIPKANLAGCREASRVLHNNAVNLKDLDQTYQISVYDPVSTGRINIDFSLRQAFVGQPVIGSKLAINNLVPEVVKLRLASKEALKSVLVRNRASITDKSTAMYYERGYALDTLKQIFSTAGELSYLLGRLVANASTQLAMAIRSSYVDLDVITERRVYNEVAIAVLEVVNDIFGIMNAQYLAELIAQAKAAPSWHDSQLVVF